MQLSQLVRMLTHDLTQKGDIELPSEEWVAMWAALQRVRAPFNCPDCGGRGYTHPPEIAPHSQLCESCRGSGVKKAQPAGELHAA